MNYSNHGKLENLFLIYTERLKFSFWGKYVDLSVIKEITVTFVVVISLL